MDELDKKQSLLESLLESVKQCQIRFGGKSELATENEEVISTLCSRYIEILKINLKLIKLRKINIILFNRD